VVGVVGTCLGTLAGLVQHSPRSVLAYSSIAKMGLITAVFGTAVTDPDAAPAVFIALAVFAMHHLMLKGTLFLGIGEWRRHGRSPWLTAVTLVLILAMVGAPFTSGAGAKLLLDGATAGSEHDLAWLFGFSALGTLFLMARLLWLLMQQPARDDVPPDAASAVWLALATSAIVLPLVLLPIPLAHSGLATLAVGLAIVVAFVVYRKRLPFRLPSVPPGDFVYLYRIAREVRSGRFMRGGFRLSRHTLISPHGLSLSARYAGALTWLLLFLLILTMTLLPG